MYLYRRTRQGFTLIELLVVIAIIGILSSVIYASFEGARQQARNKAMMSELKELQLALEVYKAQNRQYPPSGTTYPNGMASALIPNFLSSLPVPGDSRNSACTITYTSDAGGSFYKVTATRCLEGAAGPQTGIQVDADFARCPSTCGTCAGSTNNSGYQESAAFYESLAVYSAGGECQ